jgi:hypothetical protein
MVKEYIPFIYVFSGRREEAVGNVTLLCCSDIGTLEGLGLSLEHQ